MELAFPLNGYAPGNYDCTCLACTEVFTGDKRAICCLPCAKEILEKAAESFARERHAGQLYGDHPYVDGHVCYVVGILLVFGYDEVFRAAGWLHDVIEDTPTTREEIRGRFGSTVESLVWACTGVGANRRERNASIYEKITALPEAAIVKVADRIANVEASQPGGKHRQMYLKERSRFHEMVAVHAPKGLVERLEAAYASG